MIFRRPRIYAPAPPTATTEQRVSTVERVVYDTVVPTFSTFSATLSGFPDGALVWSADRPNSQFGVGAEQKWTFSGNGSTQAYALTGALTSNVYRYIVLIGGVHQEPAAAYTISGATISFASAPPNGTRVIVYAPFYGAAS